MSRWFAILPCLVLQVDLTCLPYRFIKWIAEGETIQMFGDGSQSRDFTYVDDIAQWNHCRDSGCRIRNH